MARKLAPICPVNFPVAEEFARKGDLSGLINAFMNDDADMPTLAQYKIEFIRHGIKAAAGTDTSGLIEQALKLMLEFNVELMVRAQIITKRKLQYQDKSAAHFENLSDKVVKEDLPRLAAMQDRIITLSKTMATFRHTMELSKPPAEAPRARKGSGRIVEFRKEQPEVEAHG